MTSPTQKRKPLESRLAALVQRHDRLVTLIQIEQTLQLASTARLDALTRKKRLLRDEMTYYSNVLKDVASHLSGKTA